MRAACLLLVTFVCFSLVFACRKPGGGYTYHPSMNKGFKEMVLSPRPHDYVKAEDVPADWDWRSVVGKDLTTWNRNQHVPQYCGGCWSFGSTSALSDRILIANQGQFPEVNLAPQHLISCNGGGTCDGGSALGAYEWIAANGIVEETCDPYEAKDGLPCNPPCKTYWGFNESMTIVTNNKNWTIKEYGTVRGADAIKAEIYTRGPVACSIDATYKLEKYSGGIYEEFKDVPIANHIISIVGWGSTPVPHWIVRNSWGTYWGEFGYFRIVLGKLSMNMGIENDCVWAVPDLNP